MGCSESKSADTIDNQQQSTQGQGTGELNPGQHGSASTPSPAQADAEAAANAQKQADAHAAEQPAFVVSKANGAAHAANGPARMEEDEVLQMDEVEDMGMDVLELRPSEDQQNYHQPHPSQHHQPHPSQYDQAAPSYGFDGPFASARVEIRTPEEERPSDLPPLSAHQKVQRMLAALDGSDSGSDSGTQQQGTNEPFPSHLLSDDWQQAAAYAERDQAGLQLQRHETTKRASFQMPDAQQPLVSPSGLDIEWNSRQQQEQQQAEEAPKTPELQPKESGVVVHSAQTPVYTMRKSQAGLAKMLSMHEDQIEMSDDSDSEEEQTHTPQGNGFDMKRWRRFHELNAKKPADLRAFFWKRFDPKTWSLHVVTYRNQDALFAPFQGVNIIHGTVCRMDALMGPSSNNPLQSSVFGLMHGFENRRTTKLKVLGLFMVYGQNLPSPLRWVFDEWDWAVNKVDLKQPNAKDLISDLLAPGNNYVINDLSLVCSRVI